MKAVGGLPEWQRLRVGGRRCLVDGIRRRARSSKVVSIGRANEPRWRSTRKVNPQNMSNLSLTMSMSTSILRLRLPPYVPVAVLASTALIGCATAMRVTPDEIPVLEARLAEFPDDGRTLHRYAAALFADYRCAEASEAADRAVQVAPENYVGTFVRGRCLEQADSVDAAIELYSEYVTYYSGAPGASAVEAQRRLAMGRRATIQAQVALLAEEQGLLAEERPDPDAVAVLPMLIEGGPEYAPLSRGLASLMMTDLALLERFRVVDRLELDAIVAELTLSQSELVDPATSARVGRLIRAGQTVQGSVSIDDLAELIDIQAAVVGADELDPDLLEAAGGLDALLDLEKELVIATSEALGYVPSDAERARILQNGTRNLLAFLSYSLCLEAEAAGDYALAAQYSRDAIRVDPNFEAARTKLGEMQALEVVARATAGEATQVGGDSDGAVRNARRFDGLDLVLGPALESSMRDVAGMEREFGPADDEASGDQAIGALRTGPASQGQPANIATREAVIRIIFTIP
ncbi:MAG: hypothetical protein GEU90_15470 [Gemmatimonas sp.]|nr:hypothetical protein [Gemmatimonas sp.]